MSALMKRLTSIITTLCIIGVGLVLYIQTKGDDEKYQVTAYFEKAIGLFKNSDVTILGVAVGKVSEIVPEGDQVRVDMNIDGDYKIPADTHAEIVPISVISDRYIQFDVYKGGPVLQDGATLALEDTEIPAELDDVFLQLKKLLDALKPDGDGELGSLGELIVALDEALEGREQDLKGTLVQGSKLTTTLARSGDDISALLINLDELFSKLAPRAGSIATLNKNFAIVMRFLVESRGDLEGTLEGLANITTDLGDLVHDNSGRVVSLLRRVARITPLVLKNQKSVEDSLAWLGVVGEGLKNAHHGPPFKSTDVRSNRATAGLCEDFDDFPLNPGDFPPPLDGILEDLLDQIENELCPNPPGASPQVAPQTGPGVSPPDLPNLIPELKIDCDKGVKRAKRQIRRIAEIGIPDDVKSGVLRPLEENLKELAKKCRKLGNVLDDPNALKDLLDELPPDLRDVLDPTPSSDDDDSADGLTGNASGTSAPAPTESEDDDSWVDGLMNFLGVSS